MNRAIFFTLLMLLPYSSMATEKIKVKLLMTTHYDAIRTNDIISGWRTMGHVLSVDAFDVLYDNSRSFDGTVKVTSHNGVVADGKFAYIDMSSGGILGMFASYPAIKNLKSIEFFDKAGTKIFENTNDFIPIKINKINRLSKNSFSIERKGNVLLSKDGAKTWELIKDLDPKTHVFHINDVVVDNSNTVIVVDSYDPKIRGDASVAIWSNAPTKYVLEFADDEDSPQKESNESSSTKNLSRIKNANRKKGIGND